MRGLTKRQPMVVSWISACREKAVSAFGITKGARDMLSTPPATTSSASPAADLPGRDGDRIHARAAQAVDRRSGHGDRQPRQQGRHAGDVAVVLAGLVGAAQDHLVDRGEVEGGVARHQGCDGRRGEVVGPDRRQGAAEAADRRAQVIDDDRRPA